MDKIIKIEKLGKGLVSITKQKVTEDVVEISMDDLRVAFEELKKKEVDTINKIEDMKIEALDIQNQISTIEETLDEEEIDIEDKDQE